MEQKPEIGIVVALGRNGTRIRAIGKDNHLLWHIPDDLKRFKTLTLGHPVIMGRKTFDSILASLGKPLPGRPSIVVTRDQTWAHEGVFVTHSLPEAITLASTMDSEKIFIGGGGEIYAQALPLVDKLYLTLVDDEKSADSFFPEYEDDFPKITYEEEREWEGLKYRFVDFERA